jgi:hypothetical protein
MKCFELNHSFKQEDVEEVNVEKLWNKMSIETRLKILRKIQCSKSKNEDSQTKFKNLKFCIQKAIKINESRGDIMGTDRIEFDDKYKNGDLVSYDNGIREGKITHIIYDYDEMEKPKYKIDGKYRNYDSLKMIKKGN